MLAVYHDGICSKLYTMRVSNHKGAEIVGASNVVDEFILQEAPFSHQAAGHTDSQHMNKRSRTRLLRRGACTLAGVDRTKPTGHSTHIGEEDSSYLKSNKNAIFT